MAVRIRMKKIGPKASALLSHLCDGHPRPRDGRVLEELGTYDPMVPDTDARAVLNGERIKYWLGVGAQPTEKVKVLIKKYGPGGTHWRSRRRRWTAWPRIAGGVRRRRSRSRRPRRPQAAGRKRKTPAGRRAGVSLPMRFDVLTLFPEIFAGYLGQSLLKRAIEPGLVDVQLHNIRDWSTNKHKTVDDRPFGGGPGMVMRVEPVVECVEAVRAAGTAEPATW